MATISNLTLSITRDVANAVIDAEWDVLFSAFDQQTNLLYTEGFALRGDDTNQDGDNGTPGDDSISLGFQPVLQISSNGQASTHRSRQLTIAFSNLNEDSGFANASANDDEIVAVVTYTPQLPVATTRESAAVVVTA